MMGHRSDVDTLDVDSGWDYANIQAYCIASGVSKFLFATSALILYLPILRVFRTDADFKSCSAYQIMFFLGVTDCAQLFIHAIASWIDTLQIRNLPHTVNIIIGALLNSPWFAMLILTALLTVHRVLFVLFGNTITKYGHWNNMRYVVGLIMIFWMLTFALFLSPWCHYQYYIYLFNWDYEDNLLLSEAVEFVDLYLVLAVAVICIFCYIVIFITFRFKIFLIVLYQLIGFAFWVYIQPVLPESYGLFLLSTHIWIGFNSINPIIYLIFNRNVVLKENSEALEVNDFGRDTYAGEKQGNCSRNYDCSSGVSSDTLISRDKMEKPRSTQYIKAFRTS